MMNVEEGEAAFVTCMGKEDTGARASSKEGGKKDNNDAEGRKAPGVDGITAKMLKYGGESVIEWMHLICN